MTKINMIGKEYGRLTVIEDLPPHKSPSKSIRMVLARCSCGTVKRCRAQDMRRGEHVSCGCIQKEINANKMSDIEIRIYASWNHMMSRVERRSFFGDPCRIFDGWLVFENFLDWSIKNGWSPDRVCMCRNGDVGDYTPANARWDTKDSNVREAHAKEWVITSPEGATQVVLSLHQFCKDNGFKHTEFYKSNRDNAPTSGGWLVDKVGIYE